MDMVAHDVASIFQYIMIFEALLLSDMDVAFGNFLTGCSLLNTISNLFSCTYDRSSPGGH